MGIIFHSVSQILPWTVSVSFPSTTWYWFPCCFYRAHTAWRNEQSGLIGCFQILIHLTFVSAWWIASSRLTLTYVVLTSNLPATPIWLAWNIILFNSKKHRIACFLCAMNDGDLEIKEYEKLLCLSFFREYRGGSGGIPILHRKRRLSSLGTLCCFFFFFRNSGSIYYPRRKMNSGAEICYKTFCSLHLVI